MSGMSRAHGRQSSKFKNKFEAIRKNGTLEAHKRKKIAKHEHFKAIKMDCPPKVKRGTARAAKRQDL